MVDAPATERRRMIWLKLRGAVPSRQRTEILLRGALKATERNMEAAREGAVVLTHKLFGLVQRNANTALNLITKLFNAKSFAELIELNLMHSFNQFYALFRQVDEFGELFVRVIADMPRRQC